MSYPSSRRALLLVGVSFLVASFFTASVTQAQTHSSGAGQGGGGRAGKPGSGKNPTMPVTSMLMGMTTEMITPRATLTTAAAAKAPLIVAIVTLPEYAAKAGIP